MVTFSLQGEKPVVTPSSYSCSIPEDTNIMLQITTKRLIQTQSEKERQEYFLSKIIISRNIIHFLCKITKSKFEKRNALEFFQMQGLTSSYSINTEIV
jgi:hypothetical protein